MLNAESTTDPQEIVKLSQLLGPLLPNVRVAR